MSNNKLLVNLTGTLNANPAENSDQAVARFKHLMNDAIEQTNLGTIKFHINSMSFIESPSTEEEREKTYRDVLNQYRLSDAQNHYKEYLEKNGLENNPKFKLKNQNLQAMIDLYEKMFDANVAENDTWAAVVEVYFANKDDEK